jgi:glycine C-acetyltransferase/8-amino-7-oxononanoate synthase
VIAALTSVDDIICSDALNHASIVDGCRLARADSFVYEHCDTDHLEWGLRKAAGRGSLIVTDGIFSMDGDVAPLEEIVELARRYDARVMVDDAHATGTYGPGGRGTVAEAGLEDEVDVIVGTLGKSLGAYGAYACCDKTMAKYLINSARSLIFSTALPPPVAAAAMAALALLRGEPRLVDRVQRNGLLLREALAERGVKAGESETHIVPLVIGDAEDAVEASNKALERGVFAQAIRPPTVPAGTSRLRLTVMATHTKAELREAARVLAEVTKPLIVERPIRVERPMREGVYDGLREAA